MVLEGGKMITNQSTYIAGLYLRLSKDDGAGESSSISTQRNILLSYAKDNNFRIYDEYVDDGWSGTNFERPEFKRMIKDIESGHINLVLTKDLSRLGRDYITTGQYTEIYFPSKGVRYIAINDGYDSESQYTDIVPFKNVLNEMYARDTSRKIRSAFISKMEQGSYIGNFAPYGYKKDESNKNHLIIDEEAAPIVSKIFKMAANGVRLVEIAKYLNDNDILSPIMYRCRNNNHLNPDRHSKRKQWTASTVSKLLYNRVYLGEIAQRKTTKISFKSDMIIRNPKDDWIVVPNMHDPIIDQETFNLVQRIRRNRTCTKKGGFHNVFSGLVKCADCGRNMSTVGSRKKSSPINLCCGGYKLYGSSECTNHFIDYNVLYDIVLKALQERVNIKEEERNILAGELQHELSRTKATVNNELINQLKKRGQELDGMIERLYEDNYQGKINDDRFQKLLDKYEGEAKQVNERLKAMSHDLIKNEELAAKKSYDQFLRLIEQYTNIETLEVDMLFKLIDRIEVEQGCYEQLDRGRVKCQKVKICFRFATSPVIKEYNSGCLINNGLSFT